MKSKLMSLAQYTASCSLFIGKMTNTINAQVVYTDIDPDIVLNNAFEFAYLDIDNDGLNEFLFFNSHATTVTGASFNNKSIQQLFIFGNCPGASIADSTYYHTAPGFGFISVYALIFPNNNIIDETLNFGCVDHRMAFISYFTDGGNIYDAGGNWFPAFNHKYLGVRYADNMECIHYGWIRCTVKDSANILIVEDYAFEAECDKPIIAGSTESYINISIVEPKENLLNIYPNPVHDVLHVVNNIEGIIDFEIFNLQGNSVNIDLINKQSIIVDKLRAGIYQLRIRTESGLIFQQQFEKI